MDKLNREQLSAFIDEELGSEETELLVRRLESSARLRRLWLRYSVIGDAVRGELVSDDPRRLPSAVSQALSSEPARASEAALAKGTRLLRPLAGAAVAASVAVVAVLSLSDRINPGVDNAAVTVPELASPSPLSSAYSAAMISRRAGRPDQLSRYYLNHSQYATMLGGQGPQIRMVRTPDQEEAPESEGESRSDQTVR